MNVEEIGQQLSKMEFALVHGGPRHPVYPNVSAQSQINQVFDAYPRLRKDQSYVDFLEMYAGALILYPDSSIVVLIHGIWDYTPHLLDGEFVDGKYLCFADVMFDPPINDDILSVGFAFDISNDEPGIFRSVDYDDPEGEFSIRREPYRPYCDTFVEWLDKLVRVKGRLVD